MKFMIRNKNNIFIYFFFLFLKVLYGMDIIYRDLKIKNILFSLDCCIKIVDFGVVK